MFTWGKVCKHTVFFYSQRASSTEGKQHPQSFVHNLFTWHTEAPPELCAQIVRSDMQRTASGRLVSRRVTRGQIAQSVHSVQGDRAISWPEAKRTIRTPTYRPQSKSPVGTHRLTDKTWGGTMRQGVQANGKLFSELRDSGSGGVT